MPKYYKALDLDGANEYVDCGNPAITDNLSVVAEINCDTLGATAWRGIVTDGNDRTTDVAFWLMTNYGSDRNLRLYVSGDGTPDALACKYYRTPVDSLPLTGYASVGFSFYGGTSTLLMYIDGVEVATLKSQDPNIATIHSPAGPLRIGGNPGYGGLWDGPITNVSIWDTAVLTPADFLTLHNGGLSMDPADLVPTGGAVLAHSYLWDTELPLVPGANDIPDNTGTNHGTTQNMEAADVVDSPFMVPWTPAVRPYAYNRATKTADGSRTSWLSSPAPDPAMAYHPDIPDPADYEDFVVLKAD